MRGDLKDRKRIINRLYMLRQFAQEKTLFKKDSRLFYRIRKINLAIVYVCTLPEDKRVCLRTIYNKFSLSARP